MDIDKITETEACGRPCFAVFAGGVVFLVPKTQFLASNQWGESEVTLSALCSYAVKMQDGLTMVQDTVEATGPAGGTVRTEGIR